MLEEKPTMNRVQPLAILWRYTSGKLVIILIVLAAALGAYLITLNSGKHEPTNEGDLNITSTSNSKTSGKSTTLPVTTTYSPPTTNSTTINAPSSTAGNTIQSQSNTPPKTSDPQSAAQPPEDPNAPSDSTYSPAPTTTNPPQCNSCGNSSTDAVDRLPTVCPMYCTQSSP
jgi:hypothetical protein